MDISDRFNGRRDGDSLRLLDEARRCWESWEEFRASRQRNKRYTYGRQWDDVITVDGEEMTEAEYIASQGQIPLKNNLIRRLVRNVLGTYLNTRSSATCTASDPAEEPLAEVMNKLLEGVRRRNCDGELAMRSMEEFLISGFVVCRKWYGFRDGVTDCWTDYVSPDHFFMDTATRDFRGWDTALVGEIHDVSFGKLSAVMARRPSDFEKLREIYRPEVCDSAPQGSFGHSPSSRESGSGFLCPSQPGLCRVIELWRKESRPRFRCHDPREGRVFRIEAGDYRSMVEAENWRRLDEARALGIAEAEVPLIRARWMIDEVWRYYYLSHDGHVLAEGESPYRHGRHPYVFKAYPFIDGEIHSFVADVIDQQRYTNRLITLYDWAMKASAKGVLLFPESSMPKGWTLRDVADEWSRFNGVIMVRSREGDPLPQQVSSNAANIGVADLLNIQMKMFEDISGVNGALQGKLDSGNVSGALYSYQTRNALTSLLDILESFRSYERECARTDVELIRQFYDRRQVEAVAGTGSPDVSRTDRLYFDTVKDFRIE